jgi:colicin import membrane protein
MKTKCLLQPKYKTFDSFHTIVDMRQQIKDAETLILERQKAFKTMTKNYKKSVEVMKKTIQDKPLLQERIAEVKQIMKDEKETLMNFLETKRDEITELGKEIREQKRLLLKLFKQSVKDAERERKQYEADAKAIAQQNALLSMEIADLTAFIEDDAARDVVSQAIVEMKRDLEEMEEEYEENVKAKVEAKERNAQAKEMKAREAAQAKEMKAREAAQAKEMKAREAAANKERKAQAKEAEKTRKRIEKEARRKTAKK